MRAPITLVLVLVLGAASCTPPSPDPATSPPPVAIFAASSLTELVGELAAAHARAAGQPVRPSFGASSTLARQIGEGAPADVFVSADGEWLDAVTTTARYDWVGNRLAWVIHVDRHPEVEMRALTSIALAAESVPAGKLARAALAKLGIPLPPKVISGASVRDVLAKVAEGAADAGIVYATDVGVDPRVKCQHLLPEDSHPPIRYAVGLLRPAGRELFEALRAPAALEAARRLGFTTPP